MNSLVKVFLPGSHHLTSHKAKHPITRQDSHIHSAEIKVIFSQWCPTHLIPSMTLSTYTNIFLIVATNVKNCSIIMSYLLPTILRFLSCLSAHFQNEKLVIMQFSSTQIIGSYILVVLRFLAIFSNDLAKN